MRGPVETILQMPFAFPVSVRRALLLWCLTCLCGLWSVALTAQATPTSPLRFKRLGALDSDDLLILALM